VKLRIVTPTRTVLETDAVRVVAESDRGSFGLLPRHQDWVAPLVPGILTWEDPDGEERYAAVDRGTLLKCGDRVSVAVGEAVPGEDLARLQETVRERFEQLDDRERRTRSALARLEARFLRGLVEVGGGDASD